MSTLPQISLKTIGRELRDYLGILLGTMIYALSVAAFMLPYGLTTGGVAGISSIVYYATGLEVQNMFIFINGALLLVAVPLLGLRFCLKTIYGVAAMTFSLWFFQRLLEVPDPQHPGMMMLPDFINNQPFMAAVIGAIFCGTGLAFCFESNGSTGGTDIIAAIVNKYRPMSLGTVIMACDIVIISSCYFIFHDWARVIFGFVILIITSLTLDYCIRARRQSVQFMIFSRNYRKLSDAITQMGHGATILEGMGWYTKSERKVIFTIVRRREQKDIFRIIKQIDPYSLVSMTEAKGVYGNAFDTIKQSVGKRKVHTLVCCSNNTTKIASAAHVMGDGYEIRSLLDIGCDTRQTFNAPVLELHGSERVAFIKRYFGFDAFYADRDGKVWLAEGDFTNTDYVYHSFASLEEMKAYFKQRPRTKLS